MTIASVPTGVDHRHPIRWRAMGRVTWLQHRAALTGLVVLAVGCAIVMMLSQSSTHAIYASFVAHGCVASGAHAPCGTLINALGNDETTFSAVVIALHVLPIVVGLFIGALLVAREIESGTFRYAWTQETGRTRNVLSTFAVLAAVITAVACLLGLVLGWFSHPFEVIGIESEWQSGLFDTTVFMLGAWTFLAFALGTFIGAVIGRTVASMAATALATGGLVIASFLYAVHWLFSFGAIVTANITPNGLGIGALNDRDFISGPPSGSWLVRGWLTGPNGHVLSAKAAGNVLYQADTATQKNFANNAVRNWLRVHHFTYWVSYQPASRLWQFQLVAVIVLLALAMLFIFATNRTLHRRAVR